MIIEALLVIKTQAIVIKETDYRDNDKMLTLFSPDFGRMDVLSRGCKKPDGKLMASSQMFVCGEYQFNIRSNKLYHAGCEITHPFYGLRNGYEKLYTAYLLAEVTERFILHEQEDLKLYLALVNALYALENDINPPEIVLPHFLVLCADAAGLRPNTQQCLNCGEEADDYYFVLEEGSVVCSACALKEKGEKMRISKASIDSIKAVLKQPSKALRQPIKTIYPKELTEILIRFLALKTHSSFKSYQMLIKSVNSDNTKI